MAFLTAVSSLRFPSTNNQLRTLSNPRNQATIQDGRVIVQQVQGRQGQSYSGAGYKSNATSSRGNNSSGQARVVKCYNCQEAQEAEQILDEEQLAFLADPGVPDAVLMANISNYDSDVISEEKIALKEQVDSLEKILSKQIKEKECLLQTFTVFKRESNEKEDKYMENEIDLEKKIKELDNFLFKLGYAQTLHMLTKPQAFYDNIHEQALAPKELPKISLVNEILKKLKFHLAKFDNVVKIRTTPSTHTEEFFENNDLKAQLEDKDSTICKLKDTMKSLREKSKEENVNYDYGEIETKNYGTGE
nr:hypothetical protein [Tanacetum cinerariifolium]